MALSGAQKVGTTPEDLLTNALGGCLLLHSFGVHGARGTGCKAPPKNGFHAPVGQMLQRRIIKLREKIDAAGGGGRCDGGAGRTGRP